MKFKKHTLKVAALALLILLAVAGYRLYKPTQLQAAVEPQKTVLYWHDPMVPGERFDKPGKSPFMDMQLVPVYAETTSTNNTNQGVNVSPRMQQSLGIRTAEVIKGTLSPTIEAVGTVAWNERDVVMVPARVNGLVDKLYVRAPFDAVKQGQPLAALYSPDWVVAQEEFLAVKRMHDAAQQPKLDELLEGARQRLRLLGIPSDQIAAIEAAGVVQRAITLTAPFDGVLTELNVREGSAMSLGMPLFRINKLASVWVHAEVPQTWAGQIQVGQAVQTLQTAQTTSAVEGTVEAILPEINSTTRTFKVRVVLNNPARQWLPGMFVSLRFKPAKHESALLIPSEALIVTGTRTLVMVAQEERIFKPVEVETGLESSGQIEIKKGLKLGQRVVVSGQFLLDSEASLKGVKP